MIKQLKSVAELNKIFESAKAKQAARDQQTQVRVHLGSCGIASGADKVLDAFNKELAALKSGSESTPQLEHIVVEKAACIGLCGVEPTVTVLVPGQEKVIYFSVDDEKVKQIIKDH